MQAFRVGSGFTCVMMFIEYLYVGPTDTLLLSSYLSVWGIVSTFVSSVSQYKAANYEIEKVRAISAGSSSTKYAYSPWYKRVALSSLEVSFGLNIIIFVAYWTYIFPNQGVDYNSSSLEEAFGKNIGTELYFLVRNIVIHTVPLFISLTSVLITDVVFLETDYL